MSCSCAETLKLRLFSIKFKIEKILIVSPKLRSNLTELNNCIVVSKEKKTLSGHPRFYMYSGDQEKLILVAEKQNNEWVVSTDSKNCCKDNGNFVGILKNNIKNTFVGSNEVEQIRIRKIELTSNSYNISFLMNSELKSLTQDALIDSFSFKYEKKDALFVSQIAKHEYSLNFSNNLTNFQSFCCAISFALFLKKKYF
ncbi:hypothetical protein TRFO_17752 [Tritrichomonas foetus]|uniref:Tubby C-terminal domain-containing protein n=1 Tax=Tritrichomonas foetus TaxID=1144522 RepID=A0A1J4KRU8_9EUKA|nr:hypothetical protein TRFO_17752 [Tritrichomonas foetus]|eukprot:OHT12390.1 hypothetical protein TRFO_17752 [Tritrichomonas foetus]